MKRKLLFLLFIVFGFIESRAQGDVVVTNTNYQSAFIAGYPSVYTVTVTNNGPGDVDNVTVSNPIPVGITQFSWVGDNGSSGTDVPLNDLIPTLNAGETITYTITIFVPVGYTGTLDSQASVSAPIGETDATNNTALDSDVAPAPASADIVVFKTDNDLNYTAGSTQTYTIILTNHGPAAATNVTIQDLVPAGINPATVTWTGDNSTSGTGDLNDAIPNMAVGDTIIYTVVMPVPANFDQATDLVNTVTTNSTTVDPNPLCPNCTDTDIPDPQANIVTVKTNGQTQYLADEETTYTITVTNQGPSEALNVEVTDNMPPGISVMTWSSNLGPSGTGNMVDTIATLAVGQTVTYTVTIDVPLNYNLAFVNLTNTVSVTSDTPDPVPACPGCSDTDTPRPRWVTVDVGTYTVPELVEDILIDSDCANVSNFTAQVGSSTNPGVGYFHRNNSDFPLKSGVVIRCGQAKACEGPFNDDQTSTVASGQPDNNSIGWPAANNQDLWGVNNANGNNGTVEDVSYVQFDFIPLTDNFSFKFLFASNEYGTFQCGFSDVFAFILKDQVTGALSNVAVIPSTNVPISVTSIRDQAYNGGCPSSFPQFFDQFNQGDPANADIDMRGQTVPMIASATVIPNHLYSIKLVIGDYNDQQFDSAVFIEAGSFNVGQADLGSDMLVNTGTAGCYGSSMTLDTELDPTIYDFEWTLDGVILPDTTPAITVTQEGEYCVRAYTGSCEQIDCIVVEFRDPVIPIGQEPSQATACPGNNFDLTQIEPDMFGVLNPANYDIGYYHTQFEAENEISPIGPRTNYPGFEGEIVWVKVLETNSGFDCFVVFPFVLHYENCGTANNPPDLALCDDVSNDGVEIFDLTPQIGAVLGTNPPANYIITFHLTLADANTGANDLTGINAYQNTSNPQTIYVRMEDVADATSFSTVDFTLTVHPQPATPNPTDVSACSDVGYTLPALPAGQTYHSATGGAALTEIPAGTVYNTPGTTTVYIFAQSATTPNCTAEGSFDITIIQTPATPNPANVSVCSDDGYQLPILPAGQTYHTASGGALATEVAAGTIYNTPNTTTTLYIFAQSGTTPNCTREGSFTITVHPSPATPNPADVTVCDSYLLPNLPAGQTYHSASGGSAATQIAAGTTINTAGANTIYVFAQSGTTPNCTAEGDFVVTVNTTPTAINPSNVTVCNDVGYTLPALPAGSTYHSASGGAAATLIAAGTNINTLGANTIYIYSQTGTTPNCTAEGSFVVTVNAVPTAINPSNVSVCSAVGYVLPALPAGSTYHSASGGSAATIIAAGTNINTVGANTIYIYSQTGTTPNCTAEGSFVVTVNQTPAAPAPTNVVVCSADGYTLPVLPSGQTYHSASGGSGATEILAGTVYNTPGTTTVYVFAQSGTVPNCTEEASFTITVNQTPATPNPADVTVCESIGYTLPALAAGQTYHSAPGGSAATQIASGTVIDTVGANTIYIFSQTGTTPNCTSEADFVVNVSAAPIADAPSNVTSCDSYVLPALNSGSYYGGPGGTGTSYVAGDVITSSMTMYVFAQTGTTPNCTDEHSFTISIFYSPVALPATDIHVCDDNNDGFSCLFDLTPAIAQVTGGNAALSVSFHETATDAQTGANPIAASSAYCNIVASSQTIHIRVFDPAAPQCSSQQTVDIFVDPVPVPNPVIPDYRLCDYNAPGDGQESFDLTTMDGVILNGQTGITVTYYDNNADAVLGTNAILTPTAYTNTVSPQQICARLTNDTSGCFAVACFNLVVDPLPAVFASAMNACGDATGISIFDLTSQSLTVSGGVPGLGVSYYLTQAGAQAGDATAASYIADPVNFQNTANPQVVYASVRNLATGCISVAPVTLTVSQGPPAAIPQGLEVCDPNNDCFAPFDLTLSIADILGSPVPPAGITVTFHETLTDAQNGQTPIATPGSYTNIVACDQVVYVSVAFDATGCRTVVELPIHVNLTPQATEIDALEVCDDDTDGIGTFDLDAAIADILGGLSPSGHTVGFYLTQSDAQTPTGQITNVLGFHNTTPGTQTIWVRLEDNATGCFDVISLDLIVNPKPLLPPTPTGAALPYSKCDYNNPGDEREEFDLQSQIPGILNGQTGITVTFHQTQAEALALSGALASPYINTANAQTLWVRMEDQLTGCWVLTTMDLRVEPLPELVPPLAADLTQCDADGDGFGQFALTALVPDMLQGAPDITVSFHETLADAQGGGNALASPYQNIVAFLQPLYVRAENTLTGCWSVMMIELRVIPSPVVPPLDDLTQCDTDANDQDGLSVFDLTGQEQLILNSQVGPAAGYVVSYHTSQADAQQGIGPIVGATAYANTSNPQTIWVRVEGITGGCANVGSFDLEVTVPLALTTPSQLSICDDGPTSALPQAVFDLTLKDNEITGGAPGYTVSYYETQADALADTDAIADPGAYTNIANAQTLFVAVKGPAPSFCRSFTTLTIRVLPIPVPLTADIPVLEACDDNAPVGTELFDLTQNESYIRDNDPQLGFGYYTTLAAAQAGDTTSADHIATPTAFEAGTGTIYIRVERTSEADYQGDFCYVIVEQPVVVNPLPALVAADAVGCDSSGTGSLTYGYTLSDYNALLLAPGQDVADFTFAHYLSLADAQGGVGQLPDGYTGSDGQVLTVKVTDIDTGCIAYVELTLRVSAGASAANATAAAVCDTDSDGLMDVDLTQFDATVLGGQAPAQFSVAYFATMADALAGTGALTSPYNMSSGTLYAVVTNNNTGCRSAVATVGVSIEPLVDIDITSATSDGISNSICVDFVTGALISGLTLESGLPDDGTYSFQWSLGGADIAGATASTYTITDATGFGDYVVRATTALGCVSVSDAFTVVQAGPASIAAGTSGYTVSNAFAQDQTIIVTVQGYGTYHYQLDNGPILDNGGIFTDVPPGIHTVTIYDMEGDGAEHCDSITIGGIQTIDYPRFFTPNGDGINDTWKITGLDDSAKIYIFDRYGKLVKQIAPNGLGWDGTFNGQPLPSTDYWFSVEYNELNSTSVITKEFRAHFSLKR